MLAKVARFVPRLVVFSVTTLLFGIWLPTAARGGENAPPAPPKLTCNSGTHCGIPLVDPTTAYHELGEIFAKTKKGQPCIPVPILAAAFGIDTETTDEDVMRSALIEAYRRQKSLGEDPKLRSLIFYTDSNGTRKPLDARTVRGFMATELVHGELRIAAAKSGKNTECVIVDEKAATEVTSCLSSASEGAPPADSCKSNIKTILTIYNKPQLAKLVGSIKIDKQEVTIPESSLALVIARANHPLRDSLGGDRTQPACVVQFGVSLPAITEREFLSLSLKGISSNANSAMYNCSPDDKAPVQIVTAPVKEVTRSDCSGLKLGWALSDDVLAKDSTQPFAFVISIPSAETAPITFEVNLEITANPRPGADRQMASWKLTGACAR